MTLVELFSKDGCHLCEEAKDVMVKVQRIIPFTLREVKLAQGDPYYEEYKDIVPVVHINRVPAFRYRVSENLFKIRLQQAANETRNSRGEPDEPATEKP